MTSLRGSTKLVTSRPLQSSLLAWMARSWMVLVRPGWLSYWMRAPGLNRTGKEFISGTLSVLAAFICLLQLAEIQVTEGMPNRAYSKKTVSHRPDRLYDWPCPRMECPSTGRCPVVEVVMWVHGSRLCEGCPYCVVRERQRIRRSAKLSIDTLPIAQNEVCNFASCPLKRPSLECSRPSVLDGYLHGNKCISCAFCSDDVAIDQEEPLDDNLFDQLASH